MNHWSEAYIGLPYQDMGRDRDGCDCWGCIRLVYANELGIDLPSYTDEQACAAEQAEIAALIGGERGRWPWRPVEPGSEREFDVVVIKRAGQLSHFGLVVSPGLMLHVTEGGESHVARYDTGRWNLKVDGFYRHAERAAA